MAEAILDANFLVALLDERDKWHSKATTLSTALEIRGVEAVYLDCAWNEVIAVIGKRFEERGRADEFSEVLEELKELVPERAITWLYPHVPRLYETILDLVGKHKGKINFHDALIALASKEMGIEYIASFDKDFDEIEGLKRIESFT